MRRPLAGRRDADEALDEPKQERKIEVEALGVGGAGKPLDLTVQARPVDVRQGGEGCGDLAIERDAVAGDELERAQHAALAQSQRGGERPGIGLMAVAIERRPHCLFQILLS